MKTCDHLLALLQHLLQDLLLAVEDDQVGLGHEDLLQYVPVPILIVGQLLHYNSEVLRGIFNRFDPDFSCFIFVWFWLGYLYWAATM